MPSACPRGPQSLCVWGCSVPSVRGRQGCHGLSQSPQSPSRCSTWVKAGALNPLLPTSFRDESPVFRRQGCPIVSAVLPGFWAGKIQDNWFQLLTESARPWAKQFMHSIPCNPHNDPSMLSSCLEEGDTCNLEGKTIIICCFAKKQGK